MADVFVSYKAEDRRRVQPLVQALQADGFSVWWDEHIGAGDAWRETIEQQLNDASCVVVIWSKRSVGPEGKFVREEASRAQRRGIYVAVLIDPVDPPLGFGESQATPLKGWHGDRSDPHYQAVLSAVRRNVDVDIQAAPKPVASPIITRRAMVAGGTVAAVAVASGGGWFLLRPKAAAASNRIAVLPFANLSGDPAQAYFSDGIAEELRSSLSRVGMQVIGRASCDAVRNLDIKTAAAKLDVANILTGSVRRSPQTIRIDAQLLSGSDGVERWSEVYDRQPGDTIKIQTDIAENVARALSIALGQAGRSALTIGGTTNPEAQDLVLKVVHDHSDSKASFERDLAWLDAALKLDPNYAEAYARKAFVLTTLAGIYAKNADANSRGQAEALEIANRAIAVAPTMALGYATRALVYRQRLQFRLALADGRRGVELPGEVTAALDLYASILCRIGQFEEALQLNAKAISLDPLSPGPYSAQADVLYRARRYGEAVTSARRSLAIASDQATTRSTLGNSLLAQGKVAEAEAEYKKLDPSNYRRLVGEAVIAARAGQRSQALGKLATLKATMGDGGYYQFGEVYAQLGMTEDAISELELAWEKRDPGLAHLLVDPFLDPLRKDPRIAELERRIGLL